MTCGLEEMSGCLDYDAYGTTYTDKVQYPRGSLVPCLMADAAERERNRQCDV